MVLILNRKNRFVITEIKSAKAKRF